jgi:hypothetical protein
MGNGSCKPACEGCQRLRDAVLEIIGELGLEAVEDERLSERAGIDVAEHYDGARACLYDTYQHVALSIYHDFERCFAEVPGWRRGLMLAGHTLLGRLAERPAEARLCFIEILRGDHELLRRRDASRRRLVDLLVRELGRRHEHPEQFRMQLELVIGAGFQAIATAVETGEVEVLTGLEPELKTRAFVFATA